MPSPARTVLTPQGLTLLRDAVSCHVHMPMWAQTDRPGDLAKMAQV